MGREAIVISSEGVESNWALDPVHKISDFGRV